MVFLVPNSKEPLFTLERLTTMDIFSYFQLRFTIYNGFVKFMTHLRRSEFLLCTSKCTIAYNSFHIYDVSWKNTDFSTVFYENNQLVCITGTKKCTRKETEISPRCYIRLNPSIRRRAPQPLSYFSFTEGPSSSRMSKFSKLSKSSIQHSNFYSNISFDTKHTCQTYG